MKKKDVLHEFFSKFKNMQIFKGITEECFNPLEAFQTRNITVHNLNWTVPEKAPLREKFMNFLENNACTSLRLNGGCVEKIEVPNIYPGKLKHLYLANMPNVDLTQVFNNLPELETFSINNVEYFNKEMFNIVFSKMATYNGLIKLQFVLLTFELEEVKDALFNVIKLNAGTLRVLAI